MKKFDVLILGSGISALTCALLLAKANKRVAILEKHHVAGGYLHNFKRFGLTYETGAHYIGAMDEHQPFRVLLEYLGVYDRSDFFELDPEGFDVFKFPSFEFQIGKGYSKTITHLLKVFPHEEKAIVDFFTRIENAALAFPTYNFNDSYNEFEIVPLLNTSLLDVLNQVTSNKKLQTALSVYSYLYGVDPKDTPFGMHAIVTDSLIRSAYSFTNGGSPLAEKFVQKIKQYGGEIFLNHKVLSIDIKDNQVNQVICENDECFKADMVISSMHPYDTYKSLRDHGIRKSIIDRVYNMQESDGILGIYSYLENTSSFLPKKNYYYISHEDPRELFDFKDENQPNGLFLSCPNRGEFLQGKSPLSLMGPMKFNQVSKWSKTSKKERLNINEYQNYKKEIAHQYVSYLNSNFGVDFKLKEMAISTPLSNIHYNGGKEGAAFGIYHSIGNTGPRALGPRTKIKNLLLTGQNTLFPGLLASMISGLRSSGHIIGIKPILKELKSRVNL